MAKNTVYLISGGTNYYLSAPTASRYTGSGTPWTAEATTPYRLSVNDITGPSYATQPAVGQRIFSGGSLFVLSGAQLVASSYDTLTEQVSVQLYATSKDNAVFLLRQLRTILNTAALTIPCILAVQGGTNTDYFDILGADVPENPQYVIEPAGTDNSADTMFRAVITWVRSPHGGLLATPETLINGATFTNTGTGANNNTQAFSTGTGDLMSETGQPVNVRITPVSFGGSDNGVYSYWLGSVYSRTYSTSGASSPSTSSTTTFLGSSSPETFDISPMLANRALRVRILLAVSAISSNAQVRLRLTNGDNAAVIIHESEWQTPSVTSGLLFDFGYLPVNVLAQTTYTPVVGYQFQLRSTNGASASLTYTYHEILLYYTWCNIDFSAGSSLRVPIAGTAEITSFLATSGRPCLPLAVPQAVASNSGGTGRLTGVIRGTLPRYFPSALLYVAWLARVSGSGPQHVTSHTSTVTATHAPLFRTIRGGV